MKEGRADGRTDGEEQEREKVEELVSALSSRARVAGGVREVEGLLLLPWPCFV